jgi:hypothetical protein
VDELRAGQFPVGAVRVRRLGDEIRLAKNAWDASDGVLRGGAAAGCPLARPGGGAERSAVREPGVQGPDVVRSSKPSAAAAGGELEPCTRDAARSGERSCAELAVADAPEALALLACWPQVPQVPKAASAPLPGHPEQWSLGIERPLLEE